MPVFEIFQGKKTFLGNIHLNSRSLFWLRTSDYIPLLVNDIITDEDGDDYRVISTMQPHGGNYRAEVTLLN